MSFSFPYPGPIPPYTNVAIEPRFYQPSRFVISDISFGATTTVTTTEDTNYAIGQEVRLLIPRPYGASQLNNHQGVVISIPAVNQVELLIFSTGFNPFVSNPFTASITGASKAFPCVLICSSHFVPKDSIRITDVSGMTQLNNTSYLVLSANATTVTIYVDSTFYSTYTSGGTATLFNYDTTQPQIMAIGDVNSGQQNANGPLVTTPYVPGSFIDISPA